jgi:hypothetical protein
MGGTAGGASTGNVENANLDNQQGGNIVTTAGSVSVPNTSTSAIAASGSGLYTYITHMDCTVVTGATAITLQSGVSGTTIWGPETLPVGFIQVNFPNLGIRTAANTALAWVAGTASQATCFLSGNKGN